MYFWYLFSTKVIATWGLRAAETVDFIEKHAYIIHHYDPTHVVLHVGFHDMVPESLLLDVAPMEVVLKCVREAEALLYSLVPAAQVFFSEPLPHCIAHGQLDQDYTVWNKRWRSYNKRVRQVRFRSGLDLIRHDRLWLSHCSANPDYYNLHEHFYGLHLNQDGCDIFAQDIILSAM